MSRILACDCVCSAFNDGFLHCFQCFLIFEIEVFFIRRRDISIENRVAVIKGKEKLTGTQVCATDLRAGAALILAGLVSDGETKINNIKYIDRGYEQIEKKLSSLGANIKRI